MAHSPQGSPVLQLHNFGGQELFGLGQSLMSQGQNAFTPARDSLAAWIRNAGLIGDVPSLRPDLGAPSLPWAVADLQGQPGPTFGPEHTSAHVWVFLRGLLFPGSGWSAGASAGQTNRKRLPSLCLVNPGSPDSLPSPCKTQPRAGSYHPGGHLPPTYFYPIRSNRRAQRDGTETEGEPQRPPAPAASHGTQSAPCPMSTCQRLELGDLCQPRPLSLGGSPRFKTSISIVSSCLPQNREGSAGKLKGHLVLDSKPSILSDTWPVGTTQLPTVGIQTKAARGTASSGPLTLPLRGGLGPSKTPAPNWSKESDSHDL